VKSSSLPKKALVAFCLLVLVAMLASTTYASLEKNVIVAFRDLGSDRWGLATLFDAYFGFATVWILTAAQRPGWGQKLAWLAAFLLLGNFAMAAWLLWYLRAWDGREPLWAHLLARTGARS
jgi:hypothetical protein